MSRIARGRRDRPATMSDLTVGLWIFALGVAMDAGIVALAVYS